MAKLFEVIFMDDCETESYLTVGENTEEVKERETKSLMEQLSCFMWCEVDEIREVDGYLISVKEKSYSDGTDYKRN